jgi:Asp-tRNA(Asn)/Glu-tRNA(Gln) amidotransferase A subunit family amidase
MKNFGEFMQSWDVLVSPPNTQLLRITNLTGHPQICVPCGFSTGHPRSLVFTGLLYQEGTPVRVALAYEKATKWHAMQPPGFES